MAQHKAANTAFPLASIDAVRAVWQRNPNVFWLVGAADAPNPALFVYLPLTAVGASKLVSGEFDGRAPDPALIATPGEPPAALYFWLTLAEHRMRKGLPGLARCIADASPEPVPFFSRAMTDASRTISQGMGFIQAREAYPNAPEWLLVILPEGKPDRRTQPRLDVRMVRSFEDMATIVAIRSATYLAEQFCLYSEEFDGNDFCATQFIGYVDGDPAGCIRMRYFGDFVKLERLAVRREYRHTRLAFRLVREAALLARRKGFRLAYGHAREDLVPFWRMFGGREMEGRPAFRFADINYREMTIDLGAMRNDAIRLGVDPLVSIRPEGDWDRAGPLELSNLRPSREQLIRKHTRTIRGNMND
ncbi:GNAT family N-acetyltransferase [Sphingomonas sp.]|uniref:GNAT family N-acetyltransferase n=1 Tax=Sphingomonas sp. TaxID=28214 RepID=UPI001AFD2B3D|nr:GNAT family N-acetyltransferase [Sphingomonas sp.]MBO9712901.1 GNAT family N-acetyltransferase [Sphingomonas sp.]